MEVLLEPYPFVDFSNPSVSPLLHFVDSGLLSLQKHLVPPPCTVLIGRSTAVHEVHTSSSFGPGLTQFPYSTPSSAGQKRSYTIVWVDKMSQRNNRYGWIPASLPRRKYAPRAAGRTNCRPDSHRDLFRPNMAISSDASLCAGCSW